MEGEINFYVNKKKIFLFAFLIIIFVFVIIYNLFSFNLKRIKKFDTNFIIVKDHPEFLKQNYVSNEGNNLYFTVSGYNINHDFYEFKYPTKYNYKKVYYSSEKYCLVGLNDSENSFNYKNIDPNIKFSFFDEFINKYVCYEFFGGNDWRGELAWNFQVTLIGFHTTIVINFLIFLIIYIFYKLRSVNYSHYLLAKYGFILLAILFFLMEFIAHFENTFSPNLM